MPHGPLHGQRRGFVGAALEDAPTAERAREGLRHAADAFGDDLAEVAGASSGPEKLVNAANLPLVVQPSQVPPATKSRPARTYG